MNSRSIFSVSVIFVIALFTIASCTKENEKEFKIKYEKENAIVIGTDYALSGSLSTYGTWANQGINLAVKEINARGGINGRIIRVIFEDSKGNPADAVTAYQKLREQDIDYVITFQSGVALAISPLANKDHVLQVDVSATTPDYSTPDDYTFRTGIVSTQLAEAAAKILHGRLHADRIAVITINNDAGQGTKIPFTQVYTQMYNGTIVADETFDQDSSDFRTQLLKVQAANVSIVFLVSHMKESGLLIKQAEEMGLHLNFVSTSYSVEGEDFLKLAGTSAEGVLYVAPRFDSLLSNTTEEFFSSYRKVYGEEPNSFAAQAYDGVIALEKVLSVCQYEDTECAKQKMFTLDFEGASGRMHFDRNGDVVKPVVLKQVVNSTFMEVQ